MKNLADRVTELSEILQKYQSIFKNHPLMFEDMEKDLWLFYYRLLEDLCKEEDDKVRGNYIKDRMK